MNQITQLLQGIAQGDGDASAEFLPLVYAELCWLAAHIRGSRRVRFGR